MAGFFVLIFTLGPSAAFAQSSIGAQGMLIVTRASPALSNTSLTEGYLTQPMVMGSLSTAGGHFVLEGMLDLEGLTLKRGELDAGISGEGYVDRRHPHTYVHELVATAAGAFDATRYSAALGKGFVPFGTDDPMVRPFEKYPINHHISQIVERLLAAVAVRNGPFLIEGALFNGDEPESPSDLPNSNRLWDSWSARATLLPTNYLEMQGSIARVKSPELASGGGLDQRKVSVSVRAESAAPMDARDTHYYALAEWARSSDYDGGVHAFTFTTALAEGELTRGRVAFAGRFERTERPEEERLANPFRTKRPATDFSISGRTLWSIGTARASVRAFQRGTMTLTPFVEVAASHVTSQSAGSVFSPREFYGSNTLWSTTVGVSFAVGMIHRRTGQYGAASRESGEMSMAGM